MSDLFDQIHEALAKSLADAPHDIGAHTTVVWRLVLPDLDQLLTELAQYRVANTRMQALITRRYEEAQKANHRAEITNRRAEQAEALVRDLYDEDPCWFDHHGYCQAHGWSDTDPVCPDKRAQDLIRALDGEANDDPRA